MRRQTVDSADSADYGQGANLHLPRALYFSHIRHKRPDPAHPHFREDRLGSGRAPEFLRRREP